MQYIILCMVLIATIIILALITNFNIKKIKELGNDKVLDELVKRFPSNIEICEYMLNKLQNKHTKIVEKKDSQANLYLIINDTISIANIDNTYTRVQTIAHECLHSIQNKVMLWFNFIYSNIHIILYLIIVLLTIFGVIKNGLFWITILTIMALIFYFVRSELEIDAMLKARFLAKEYIQQNKLTSEGNIELIIKKYDKLNDLGVKATCFTLISGQLIKIAIYCIICFFVI